MSLRVNRHSSAFTLVELLVVIGVIAVLIAMILPALNKARAAAAKAACLSNQRQLMGAIHIYANQYRGGIPQPVSGANASGSHIVFARHVIGARRGDDNGWFNLGLLFSRNFFKDPRGFYCPAQTDENFMYPKAWEQPYNDPNFKYIGYSYRLSNDPKPGWISSQDVQELLKLKVGRFKGIKALSSDIIGPRGTRSHWPHTQPYGVCVGYSDGHAEFIYTSKREYDIALKLPPLSNSAAVDGFQFHMFKAFDTKDFTKVRELFSQYF
jgi:prepilin-type N-terminal cleavage/methylation domain-containing protein